MIKLIKVLAGVLFISACALLTPTELQNAISSSTSQPSALAPTTQVAPTITGQPTAAFPSTPQPSQVPPTAAASQTPADQPFALPGGRLLLRVGWTSEVRNAQPDFPFFNQYRWLGLPDMILTAHPYLAGDYPTRDQDVTLSPDQAQLAFAHEIYTKSGSNLYHGVSVSVLLADLDGNQTTQIGQPFAADGVNHALHCGDGISWSGDSKALAFTRSDWKIADSEHHLYVYDVESGQLHTFPVQAKQPWAYAMSPDGGQIAFTANDADFSLNIYLINADGSNERLLVKGLIGSNLAWHPDGKQIFFANSQNEPGLYSVDVASGATTLVTTTSDKANCLELSPDLSLLTYDDDGIWVVSPAGGEPLQLTHQSSNATVWSPDSQHIAYLSVFTSNIYVMDKRGNGKVSVYVEDKMEPLDIIGWLP